MKKLIILLIILSSCTARKSEITKDKILDKETEKIDIVSIGVTSQFETYKYLDKGVIYVREFSESGSLTKETFTKNDKIEESTKKKYSRGFTKFNINKTTYKSVITYKKNTQKEAVSIWVWVIAFTFLLIYLKWDKLFFRFRQ